jgi:hypothetical protein
VLEFVLEPQTRRVVTGSCAPIRHPARGIGIPPSEL